jgi:hypothetical protein
MLYTYPCLHLPGKGRHWVALAYGMPLFTDTITPGKKQNNAHGAQDPVLFCITQDVAEYYLSSPFLVKRFFL